MSKKQRREEERQKQLNDYTKPDEFEILKKEALIINMAASFYFYNVAFIKAITINCKKLTNKNIPVSIIKSE